MSDRSLDDFAADSEEADTEDSDETAEADEPDEPPVDPAVATSTFHTDGAACESCGDSVSRRWLDDGAYVCLECKAW